MRKLFSFLLFSFSLASAAQIPSYVPTNGLVGYWPFNGNANDESGNGNNGVVNGTTLTTDRFGNVGRAYSFNNNTDLIEINPTQNNLTAYTLSGWFKKSIGSLGGAFFVGSRYPTNSFGLLMGIDNNQEIGFGAEYGVNSVWTYSNGSSFLDDNWHFFCAKFSATSGSVIDTSRLTVIIDNTELIKDQRVWGNQNLVKSPIDNNIKTILGNYTYNQTGSFHGSLDDIAIYNRALTPQEITQLYTSSVTPSTLEDTTSNVGIGTTTPKRKLHVNDVMRLEPRNTAPANPGEGDIYYDGLLKKLRYYNGTGWISL